MTKYMINGQVVTKEEFFKDSKGIDFNKPFKKGPEEITAFLSPVDGSVISNRGQLREHEKRHGIRQVGNDLNK